MLLEMLEKDLQLSTAYLDMLARTASHRYKEYFIPKASGGLRQIFHPARELKTVQRWIHKMILCNFPVHPAAGAYRPRQGLLSHVSLHKGACFLLRMDFEDFFPSLTADDVHSHFRAHIKLLPVGWSYADTELLVKLVCRRGRLTIGAITSPALSNTLCYELDSLLDEYCKQLGVMYTRYADDMFFSTQHRDRLSGVERRVIYTVKGLKWPKHLRVNADKTRHSSKKGRMAVTGLVLTSDGQVSLGHQRKRRVRALVHQWDDLMDDKRRSLAGYLAYCMAVEPRFVDALCHKYGAQRIAEIRELSFSEGQVLEGLAED